MLLPEEEFFTKRDSYLKTSFEWRCNRERRGSVIHCVALESIPRSASYQFCDPSKLFILFQRQFSQPQDGG